MCTGIFPACMSTHIMCVWYPHESKKGIGFRGTEVTDSCDATHGCWELNLHPPEE